MFDLLSVSVLPACDAYDFEAFGARLRDQWLLIRSVAICVHRMPLLAVPVGGSRLGGFFAVGSYEVASAVRDLLHGRPGFPHLRIRVVTAAVPEQWRVEWGEEPPSPKQGTTATLSGFYGYTPCCPPAGLGTMPAECPAPSTPSPPFVPPRDGGGEGHAAVNAWNELPRNRRLRLGDGTELAPNQTPSPTPGTGAAA